MVLSICRTALPVDVSVPVAQTHKEFQNTYVSYLLFSNFTMPRNVTVQRSIQISRLPSFLSLLDRLLDDRTLRRRRVWEVLCERIMLTVSPHALAALGRSDDSLLPHLQLEDLLCLHLLVHLDLLLLELVPLQGLGACGHLVLPGLCLAGSLLVLLDGLCLGVLG